MLYTARKGQEHKLVITENIHDENEFMWPAYHQAMAALQEIVVHAKAFNRNNLDHELYGYSQNIIAFSGERGQGKTSTMVSFSKAMASLDLREDIFSDCAFHVLPPIDPTAMERTQSILGVILSRMYHCAEMAWGRNGRCFSLEGPTEAQKNELLMQFQCCLNGINSVKYRKGDELKGLIEINEMGDGSQLKQNLYKLTHKLLSFISSSQKATHPFLVIQLDDTDSQIHAGYEILEDIRKFFSIPNVVILMATDITLLRKVVLQHHLTAFETNLKWKKIELRELEKIESKYIDKLIPPTHLVLLPRLDNCTIHHSKPLAVRYENENGVNILLETMKNAKDSDISTQALILRYIYRKTGIVFAAPTNYFHNIIPTTLRGLAQMLKLLSFMKDVPEPKTDSNISVEELKKHVRERVEILSVNLPLFENYFLNEWLEAKLPEDYAKIVRDIASTVPSERSRRIIELLSKTYDVIPQAANMTYHDLVSYMNNLEKVHRTDKDFYLFFSIHTCLTILYHKAALRQMQLALDRHTQGLLIFDFSFNSCFLPDTLFVPKDINVSDDCKIFSTDKPDQKYTGRKHAIMQLLYREYLPTNDEECQLLEDGKITVEKFSFMHFITLVLSLGRNPKLQLVNLETSQSWLYHIQMTALTVVTNWDVQNKITKKLQRVENNITGRYLDVLSFLFAKMDEALVSINQGNDGTSPDVVPPMLQKGLHDILECMKSDKENVYQVDIAACFGDIEMKLGPVNEECINSLQNIYAAAQKLKTGLIILKKDPNFSQQFELTANMLLEMCLDFNIVYQEQFGADAAFNLMKIEANSIANPVSATAFWNNFQAQFAKVCQTCRVDEKKVKRRRKGKKAAET